MNTAPTSLVPAGLAQMRFAPEAQQLNRIMETFDLEPILAHFESEGGVTSIRDHILSSQLKLTRTMAPRLSALLDGVRGTLGFEEPVDLFVGEDSSINAFAVYALDDTPHIIGLTSQLIERMNDDEIKFVLGHEIGHLCYKHYRMKMVPRAFGKDSDGDSNVPNLLARRLDIWERLAELSADRAGYTAIEGRLDAVVSVFFKLASGLGPEHLQFDISAFLQQLEELRQLEHRDSLCDFSHPSIPIRVRALQLYRDADGAAASTEQLARVDEEVLELAKLMERAPLAGRKLHQLNYILAGGVLVGHSDGQGLGDRESKVLIEMLLPMTSDPEEAIAGITTVAQAEQMLAESAAWMRENAGEWKFDAFRYLCIIAVSEGLTAKEAQFLQKIAALTGIPPKAAGELIHEVTTNFGGKKAASTNAPIHLR